MAYSLLPMASMMMVGDGRPVASKMMTPTMMADSRWPMASMIMMMTMVDDGWPVASRMMTPFLEASTHMKSMAP